MSVDLAYRAVFQSVSDAILILSEEGRAIDCNPAALALYRCSRDELIGTTPNDWSRSVSPMDAAATSPSPSYSQE
ncbi:MAG: PAS domain S-box protein [Sulfuritalea sp.]|nr:PAS domain S-box protein [Sulfuritalea sp.]